MYVGKREPLKGLMQVKNIYNAYKHGRCKNGEL